MGLALAFIIYQMPAVKTRVDWRIERALVFARGIIDPVQPLPTAVKTSAPTFVVNAGSMNLKPLQDEISVTATVMPSPTLVYTGTPSTIPTPSPTLLPDRVVLTSPPYEMQDINNCGPATLSMNLNFYNWGGDQFDISDLIKPIREDRNVNIEELVYYIRTQVPGFDAEFRVAGDINLLRRLLAEGFPVVIEESMQMDESFWFNDDLWAGHYLLLTGYDDQVQSFIAQDSFKGPERLVKYSDLDRNWRAFNRVYLLVYPKDARAHVQNILGYHWDVKQNRQFALEMAQSEINLESTDPFAWFNLGSNLVYFEKYFDAASAYDTARSLGLPQRMLRYQFGPFFAYFHTNRIDDLIVLTDYALKRTPNAEEAMLWKGWALYRQGKKEDARNLFQKALEVRPGYQDAEYGLNFLQNN